MLLAGVSFSGDLTGYPLWALLFCLSELARYYPDTWVSALDPDRSRAAVTLEHGLDVMLERTPRLITRR